MSSTFLKKFKKIFKIEKKRVFVCEGRIKISMTLNLVYDIIAKTLCKKVMVSLFFISLSYE